MTKILCSLAFLCALALPAVHPFGRVKQQQSTAALPPELAVLEKACQNCHSERTEWPFYSYLPLASWAIEKDVAEARQHMNLSHWDEYSAEEKRDLLARIGTEVRNRRMPLPRYLLLHPEARLSDDEIQSIYEWTKDQRRVLRNKRE